MSDKVDSILDKDLYELFGVLQDASVKDIKTAYRKKALECHPDKNPDNPKANELFHELSRALAVLIDQSARAAYDKVLNAKLAAKKRHQVLDSRRKKFKEDLEEREKQAQEAAYDIKTDTEKFQKEFEKLRKLSSKQVEEEINYVKELLKERKAYSNDNTGESIYRLKLKWSTANLNSDSDYSVQILENIFSKYGSVSAVALSLKKKGSALIEFSNPNAATNAYNLEKGHSNNPLIISWVGNPPQNPSSKYNSPTFPNIFRDEKSDLPQNNSVQEDDDFEAEVLQKLREAERQKKSL